MDDDVKWLLENGWKAYPLPDNFVIEPPEPKPEPIDEFTASILRTIERVEACGRDPTKLFSSPSEPFTGEIDPNNPFHASLRR